jgi:hypothetical protein
MQGRGITNYNADKPTYGYSIATTEFDDALIQRGIVTTEQVMMAKGASISDAFQLAQEKRNQHHQTFSDHAQEAQAEHRPNYDEEDNDDDEYDDDEFLARYRQERLAQLKSEHNQQSINANYTSGTHVKEIVRKDWMMAVNEASQDRWIVVALIDSPSRQNMLQELNNLVRQIDVGRQHHNQKADDGDTDCDDETNTMPVSFCVIRAAQAIENWPSERVPALFAYRHGLKQKEWIAPSNGVFPSPMEPLLRKWGIL